MKKIKKIKHRVAALLLSLLLMSGLITPAFTLQVNAEAVEVLNSSTTIADIILSYCASGGSAIVNSSLISDLYNYVGSDFGTLQTFVNNGWLTYSDGTFVDTGLSTNIQTALESVSSTDIGSLFAQTASQNPAGVALSGGATLAGIAGSVASTGVLPLTIGVGATAFAGFQLGTLIANMAGLYGECAYAGLPVTIQNKLSSMPVTSGACLSLSSGKPSYLFYSMGYRVVCLITNSGSQYNGNFYVFSDDRSLNTSTLLTRLSIDSGSTYDYYVSINNGVGSGGLMVYSKIPNPTPAMIFNSDNERNDFVNRYKSGNASLNIYSPDLIGEDGNVKARKRGNEYTLPDVLPQIDPSSQSVDPSALTLEDWLRFANQAGANNATNTPTGNDGLLDSILDALRLNVPTPGGETNPDPDPDPGVVPTPTPNPDPDYDVDQPDTNTQESETPETDPNLNPPDFVVPDLMDKFPFCIPNDIATIFGMFRSQNRQAPYISWRFNPPGTPIDYTFNLNLSQFEEVAALLRTLELIAFVVGLAYATRYLIGSS